MFIIGITGVSTLVSSWTTFIVVIFMKLPLMIVAFGSFVLDGLGLLSAKYFYVVAFVVGLFIYGYLFYCLMYIQDEYRRSTSLILFYYLL